MNPLLRRTALFMIIAAAIAWPHGARAATRNVVAFSGFAPGTIVVKTSERRLYFVIDGDRALRFPVGVGRAGMTLDRQRARRRQIRTPGLVATRHDSP